MDIISTLVIGTPALRNEPILVKVGAFAMLTLIFGVIGYAYFKLKEKSKADAPNSKKYDTLFYIVCGVLGISVLGILVSGVLNFGSNATGGSGVMLVFLALGAICVFILKARYVKNS